MRLWKGLIFAAVLSAAAASAQEPVLLLAVASDRSVPFDAAKGPRALYLKFPKGDLLSGVIPGDIVLVQPAQASELAQDAPKLRLVPDTARQRAKADPSSEWRFSDPCGGFWRGDVSADGGSLRLTPFAAAYVIRGPLTANPDCSLLRNSKELAVFLKQNGYALSSGKPLTQERVFRELSLTETLATAQQSRQEQTAILEFNPTKLQLEQQEQNERALPSPTSENVPQSIPSPEDPLNPR